MRSTNGQKHSSQRSTYPPHDTDASESDECGRQHKDAGADHVPNDECCTPPESYFFDVVDVYDLVLECVKIKYISVCVVDSFKARWFCRPSLMYRS